MYTLSLNNVIFKYTSDKNLSMLLDRLQSFRALLLDSRFRSACRFPTGLFFCNLFFIPCNLTTGTPRPICSRSCSQFFSACNTQFNVLLDFSRVINFPFMHNCENTLHHINMSFGYPNSSSDFEDDCLDLPGRIYIRVYIYIY